MGAACKCIKCTTPGFGFHPNDEQLINRLMNKLLGRDSPGRQIAEVADLSKWYPWELYGLLSSEDCDDHDDYESRYFYWTPVYKKNGVSRTAKGGFWKPTGKVRPIKARGTREKIGEKRTLVFYLGTCGKRSQRTPWVIHEYYFTVTPHQQNEKVGKNFVLCKLKLKEDGKTEIPNIRETQSSQHSPSDFNGVEDQTSLQLSSNSTLGEPWGEESQLSHHLPSDSINNIMRNGEDNVSCYFPSNYQDPAVQNPGGLESQKGYAMGNCESIRTSPNFGDPAAGAGNSDEEQLNLDELLALLDSPDGCNAGDDCVPSLPLMPGEQTPACKLPVSYGFNSDNSGGNQPSNCEKGDESRESCLTDWNEVYLGDASNQLEMISDIQAFNWPCLMGSSPLVVSTRKRSHSEDGGLGGDANPEAAQAKRAHLVCCSKNETEEKACYQAFSEDEQGFHLTSGLQNKTFECRVPEADSASTIDHEEQDFSLASLTVMQGQGVPTTSLTSSDGLKTEHNGMQEQGLSLQDLVQSGCSGMGQDRVESQMKYIGQDEYAVHSDADLEDNSCQGAGCFIDDGSMPFSSWAEAFLKDNCNSDTEMCNPLCESILKPWLCNALANSEKHMENGFCHAKVLITDPSSIDLIASVGYQLRLELVHENFSLNSTSCISLYKFSTRKVVVVENSEREYAQGEVSEDPETRWEKLLNFSLVFTSFRRGSPKLSSLWNLVKAVTQKHVRVPDCLYKLSVMV